MSSLGNKIILYVFVIVTLVSVVATYYRYVVERDFVTIDDTEEEFLEEDEEI